MNDCRPELSSHLLDERDVCGQEQRRRFRRSSCRRYDSAGLPRRTFSGKGAVADQHADMVDTQAGYGICFRWCRYFIDLRQHQWTLWCNCYRPLKCGLRFSMKARRPSRKSSLSMQARPIRLIASMSRLSGSFSICAMVILAAWMASGALPEMVRAIFNVALHSSVSGTTRSTRPIRTASAESMRMPVYIKSRAHDGPTSETRLRKPS